MQLSEAIDKQYKKFIEKSWSIRCWDMEVENDEVKDFILTAIKQAILDIVPEAYDEEGKYKNSYVELGRISYRQELLNRIEN